MPVASLIKLISLNLIFISQTWQPVHIVMLLLVCVSLCFTSLIFECVVTQNQISSKQINNINIYSFTQVIDAYS